MMTAAPASAAFDFARQLHDAGFRAHLARQGFISHTTAVVLDAGAPWARAEELADGITRPVLVAQPNADCPFGWELRWLNGRPAPDQEDGAR